MTSTTKNNFHHDNYLQDSHHLISSQRKVVNTENEVGRCQRYQAKRGGVRSQSRLKIILNRN